KDYSTLLTSINKYITDKTGKYGIHFISLTNNQEFGISENDGFVAASTVKVPINLYLYKKIASKEVDPNEKITYKECDYEEGTGSIQDEDYGSKYTIDELSRRSIEESDNVAINMLLRYLGSDEVNNFKESVLKHPVDRDRNILSPKDMSYFMKDILDFKEKHPKEGEKLLYYLKNTEFNDRIPKYLPSNVAVAHKIGNQVNVMNDSGIIFADKPFILSVFSKDVNEDEACEVIGKIAKMIYDFEES
ncbi:MAG TPA: serine hydrolase, partial [Clostridia bacterium]